MPFLFCGLIWTHKGWISRFRMRIWLLFWRYLALCNNHFSSSRGSDRSPLEMVSGGKLSKPVCTLCGDEVLVEILIQFVSILHFQQGMLSVLSFTWDWNEVELYKVSFVRMASVDAFCSWNIRAISPLGWDLNSGQGVLTQFDNGTGGSGPKIVNDSGTAPADLGQLPPKELRKLKGQSLQGPSQPKLVLPESSSVKKKPELRLAPAVPLVLGRPFWAKPVLRRFSGPRIGSVGASRFVDDQAGCISVAAWTHLKLASYYFVASGGLIVCC